MYYYKTSTIAQLFPKIKKQSGTARRGEKKVTFDQVPETWENEMA